MKNFNIRLEDIKEEDTDITLNDELIKKHYDDGYRWCYCDTCFFHIQDDLTLTLAPVVIYDYIQFVTIAEIPHPDVFPCIELDPGDLKFDISKLVTPQIFPTEDNPDMPNLRFLVDWESKADLASNLIQFMTDHYSVSSNMINELKYSLNHDNYVIVNFVRNELFDQLVEVVEPSLSVMTGELRNIILRNNFIKDSNTLFHIIVSYTIVEEFLTDEELEHQISSTSDT